MDESGYRIGVGRGQWVVIPAIKEMSIHQFIHLIGSIGSTKHLIMIKAILTKAITIDLFIIIKGVVI